MITPKNAILIIQTSESSSILVTKDFIPYDDPGHVEIGYSIREREYWSDSWHTDLLTIIDLIEFPHKSPSCKRDYISWWLNCKPKYVDDSVKPILKKRLEAYHLTGEIRNACRNTKSGLEFNADCLYEWHKILNVELDNDLLGLIKKEENTWPQETKYITIFFEGFIHLPYLKISLKTEAFLSFQILLNYLFGLIRNEVKQYSYGEDWILYNSINGMILQKDMFNDTRSLNAIGINQGDKLICYKKNLR